MKHCRSLCPWRRAVCGRGNLGKRGGVGGRRAETKAATQGSVSGYCEARFPSPRAASRFRHSIEPSRAVSALTLRDVVLHRNVGSPATLVPLVARARGTDCHSGFSAPFSPVPPSIQTMSDAGLLRRAGFAMAARCVAPQRSQPPNPADRHAPIQPTRHSCAAFPHESARNIHRGPAQPTSRPPPMPPTHLTGTFSPRFPIVHLAFLGDPRPRLGPVLAMHGLNRHGMHGPQGYGSKLTPTHRVVDAIGCLR